MRITLLFLLNFSLFTLLGAQENIDNNRAVRFGFELGLGTNDMIPYITINEFPQENLGGYFGLLLNYNPKNSILSFDTGLRYQKKGSRFKEDGALKINYLLVPLELRFRFLNNRKFGFFFKTGLATGIKINDEIERNVDWAVVDLNCRVGGGLSLKIKEDYEIVIQCLRTISAGTYSVNSVSPGGNSYLVTYKNSGLEYGIQFFRRIK